MRSIALAAALGLVFGCLLASSIAAADTCDPKNPVVAHSKDSPPDLLVSGECHVPPDQTYYFGSVNVVNGGRLIFDELGQTIKKTQTDFWASSIIIENEGALVAGDQRQPFGLYGGVLTIHLYGEDQSTGDPTKTPGLGALCRTLMSGTVGPCGIPLDHWNDNGKTEYSDLPGGVTDYFYQYGPLHGDDRCTNNSKWSGDKGCGAAGAQVGYFGYKVLAVSYGGTLQLFGAKGACYSLACFDPRLTHSSWTRLETSLTKGDGVAGTNPLIVDGPSNYRPWNLAVSAGDQIVVTTTDYLPGHSETFVVQDAEIGPRGGAWVETIWVDHGASWPHNGEGYSLADLKAAGGRLTIHPDPVEEGVETRAAVALLNRSIQIVSGGDKPGDEFPASTPENPCMALDGKGPCYSFGGHTVFRQGFAKVQVQGVEFRQLGQGGRLAHYPVHFHMARKPPADTFVRDSSVNESMTRWMVLHSTQGVTLAGNVGYKSIGHGYYFEDGTETDNHLYANIGIFARGAVANNQNPRRIPGILSDNTDPAKYPPPNLPSPGFPYRSDSEHPTAFWITNGWNDFQGNFAAGAGTCGACYWLVPAANSDMPDVPNASMGPGAMPTNAHMKWTGYSALQKDRDFAGSTPLKSFYGNYCTSAMLSFQTTPDSPACDGFIAANTQANSINYPTLNAVKSIAPEPARHTVTDPDGSSHTEVDPMNDSYYPYVVGARLATQCPLAAKQNPNGPPSYDCSSTPVCSNGNIENCSVTVLDHYTSSFNWANGNISAVWLRPQWYLLDNSALTDVQNGALTFITGGDFTHASIIQGYWALARNSVFVGHSQPQDKDHAFASDSGPFNTLSGTKCDELNGKAPGPYCLNSPEAISMPVTGWFSNQRLFNIYDGPAYQDSNAYLDITKTPCPNAGYNGGCIYGSGNTIGVATDPANPIGPNCYLPNAAIAWKQPNGFFYPPAFHSTNLFFDKVDIRHYVIDPLFQPDTYITDSDAAKQIYCFPNSAMFNGFTGIDRQTELNDDDGTLTGLSNSLPATPPNPLKQTISVNEDQFFNAPVETPECGSNVGQNSNPVNACGVPSKTQAPVTAKTSPYDYVATVVFHPVEIAGSTEIWSKDCTNPSCYGVPLFRQYLAGVKGSNTPREWADWDTNCNANQNTPQCRWPFIRMAGEAIATRETLTVNHGAYYLDTTVPHDMQNDEKYNQQGDDLGSKTNSFNVFHSNETYTVFFLYLKPETEQHYQIYVGKGAANNGAVKPVQVSIATADLSPKVIGDKADWLDPDTSAVATTGIVTVNLDFSKAGTLLLPTTPSNGLCQPHTFCKRAGDQCVGVLPGDDPRVLADPNLKKEADTICGQWAMKDLDCPAAGCLGFQFTLPPTFQADATLANPSPHRPAPQLFPAASKNDPNWPQFVRTLAQPDSQKSSDPRSCYYPRLPTASDPGPDQCTVP
jgi:cell migration-inducing and hyaluronan-binding protein